MNFGDGEKAFSEANTYVRDDAIPYIPAIVVFQNIIPSLQIFLSLTS